MARSTKITIETDSLLIFRGRTSRRSWCTQCGKEVEMIALEKTSPLSSLLPHEWDQWLSSGDLHCTHPPGGGELTCLDSLLAWLAGKQTK